MCAACFHCVAACFHCVYCGLFSLCVCSLFLLCCSLFPLCVLRLVFVVCVQLVFVVLQLVSIVCIAACFHCMCCGLFLLCVCAACFHCMCCGLISLYVLRLVFVVCVAACFCCMCCGLFSLYVLRLVFVVCVAAWFPCVVYYWITVVLRLRCMLTWSRRPGVSIGVRCFMSWRFASGLQRNRLIWEQNVDQVQNLLYENRKTFIVPSSLVCGVFPGRRGDPSGWPHLAQGCPKCDAEGRDLQSCS